MSLARPFSPLGAAVAVTAPSGSGSASIALPGSGGHSCKVTNTIAFPVSVTFSTVSGGAVVTATSIILCASESRVIGIPDGTSDCAAWGIGGTGSVYFNRGEGGI